MKIIIKKKSDNKHTISYIREGFEDYWIEADNFLVIHDLCHFAIESTLQYKHAFGDLFQMASILVFLKTKKPEML